MIAFALATYLAFAQHAGGAAPLPESSAPTSAVEDTKVTERVRGEFGAWQRGKIDRSRYSSDLNMKVDDRALARFSERLQEFGALRTVAYEGSALSGPTVVYNYRLTCANGALAMEFGIDRSGKISVIGFHDAAARERPARQST